MSILAQFQQHHESADRRGSPRRSLKLEVAEASPSAPEMGVIIHDLSLTGLLIETSTSLTVGELLQVQIPEAGIVAAEVVWNSGRLFGCGFKEPISKASLSAALLRSPALNFEDSKRVLDALAEMKALQSTVGRLSATVGALLEQHGELQAAANPETLAVDNGAATDDEVDRPVSAFPDVPAYANFGDEQAQSELTPESQTAGLDIIVMASLVVSLLIAALFVYALLTFEFST